MTLAKIWKDIINDGFGVLFEVEIDYYTYEGAGEWVVEKHYQYACGLKNLEKACLEVDKDDYITNITTIPFSLRNLLICLKKTYETYPVVDLPKRRINVLRHYFF